MTDNAADQAREAARVKTGQFGTQSHTDPGIVPVAKPVRAEKSLVPIPSDWYPDYVRSSMPGGVLIHNIRYLDDRTGYIANNYPDGQWRIARQVTELADAAPTFPTRGKAAAAENRYSQSETVIRAQLDWLKKSLAGRKASLGMDPKAISWCEERIAQGEKILTDADLPINKG